MSFLTSSQVQFKIRIRGKKKKKALTPISDWSRGSGGRRMTLDPEGDAQKHVFLGAPAGVDAALSTEGGWGSSLVV